MGQMRFNDLMNSYGRSAEQNLVDALRTVPISGDGASLFAAALFLLLEREFKAGPTNEKAILIWELFFLDNYKVQKTSFMVPSRESNPEWAFLTFIDLSLEAQEGVSQDVALAIQTKIMLCITSCINQKNISKAHRWIYKHGSKAIGMPTAGPSRNIFSPIAAAKKEAALRIGQNMKSHTDDLTTTDKIVFNSRSKLKSIIKNAGFDPLKVGIL